MESTTGLEGTPVSYHRLLSDVAMALMLLFLIFYQGGRTGGKEDGSGR